MSEVEEQTRCRLDQDLLEMTRRLAPDLQRDLVRQFVCGAVAQPAEQRALDPSIVVRTHAAQVNAAAAE